MLLLLVAQRVYGPSPIRGSFLSISPFPTCLAADKGAEAAPAL